MSPKEEKKQEEKQREVSDAELQKVAGGALRLKEAGVGRIVKRKALDVELTGVTGGTGGVILEKVARKKR